MNLKIISISSILMALNIISESKEFCEQFKKNGNEISFIFRRMEVKPSETITFDLFIENEFWRLQASDSDQNFELEFKDNKRIGRRFTELRDDYQMATSFIDYNGSDKYKEHYAAFFTDTNVIFVSLPHDYYNEDNKTRYKELKKHDRPGTGAFAISGLFGFRDTIELVEKVPESGRNSLKATQFFLESVDKPLEKTPQPLNETTVFKVFRTNYDIIGVHTMPDTHLKDWILILMANRTEVLYCITPFHKTSEMCKEPILLIDCNAPEGNLDPDADTDEDDDTTTDLKIVSSTDLTDNQKYVRVAIIFIMSVVVLILVVSIIIMIYILCSGKVNKKLKLKKKKDNQNEMKAESEAKSVEEMPRKSSSVSSNVSNERLSPMESGAFNMKSGVNSNDSTSNSSQVKSEFSIPERPTDLKV